MRCSAIVLSLAVLLLYADHPALQGQSAQPDKQPKVLYTNSRHHYQLSYTGSLGTDYGTPSVDLVYITIDPKAEPIHVCAADNLQHWTSEQLFEEWKRKPPITDSQEFPCADYPSYARVTGSALTMAGLAAYQVVSFRGPFETVCSYLATAKTLLAICLPPENPAKAPAWQAHLSVYNELVASVKVSE
jgi:hypothetical protein